MDKRIALQHAAMFWRDNLARGLLSVVGIVIGIIGLVVASAIDRGAQSELESVARSSGTGLVHASTNGNFASDTVLQLRATLADRVHSVASYKSSQRSVVYRNSTLPVRVTGVEPDYLQATALAIKEGRFIVPFDAEREAQVVVINEAMAHALLPVANKLRSEVVIKDRSYAVVGVVTDGEGGPVAYTPIGAGARSRLVVAFTSEQTMRASLPLLRRALQVRVQGTARPVEIVIPLDAIREQQQVRRLVSNVLVVFAVLVLGLGGLGVANVMLLNVLTRIREIALRRALGARARDIVLQFSAETSVVCAVGGLLAMLCAPLCCLLLMSVLDWPLRVDLYVLLVALLATALIAAAASVVPARRAGAVPPAEGLA